MKKITRKFIVFLLFLSIVFNGNYFCIRAEERTVIEENTGKILSCGEKRAALVDSDGTIRIWGDKKYYSVILDDITNAVAVATGGEDTYVLKEDGTVWLFGRYDSNFQIQGLNNVSSLSAGYDFSVAVENGKVWGWGNGSKGQLGNGALDYWSVPVEAKEFGDVKLVSAGYDHVLALTSNGKVYAWGTNQSGQLGNGSVLDSNIPVIVNGLENIKSISAGKEYSIAIKEDGTVFAWGKLPWENLTSVKAEASPLLVEGLSEISEIACGYDHMLALKTDGTVWAMGSNKYGQLGDDSKNSSNIPVKVKNIDNISTISAGDSFSIAKKNDGSLWAWGLNNMGQLRDLSYSNSIIPVLCYVDKEKPSGISGFDITVEGGKAHLSWDSSLDNHGISKYFVFRNGEKIAAISGGNYGTTIYYSDKGLKSGESYVYFVKAMDFEGNMSEASETIKINIEEDTQPPEPPGSIGLRRNWDNNFTLYWPICHDDFEVKGYEVIMDGKCVASDSQIKIDMFDGYPVALLYSFDFNFEMGKTYVYTIRVIDTSGNIIESKPFEIIDYYGNTIEDAFPILVSDKIEGRVEYLGDVDFFKIKVENTGNYFIKHDISSDTSFRLFDSTGKEITSSRPFMAHLNKDEDYYFRVQNSYSSANDYRISFIYEDNIPPPEVTDLRIDVKNGFIALSWTASKDNIGVKGYKIYRNDEEIGETESLYFVDKDLEIEKKYKYTVKAFDYMENYSNEGNTVEYIKEKDTEAPTVPLKPYIYSWSDDVVYVHWYESYDNQYVKGYKVDCNGIESITYQTSFIIKIDQEKPYVISVKAFDEQGNESGSSEELIIEDIKDIKDKTIPVIESIKPNPSCFAKAIDLKVTSKDNIGIKSVLIQDSLDGENWSDVITIEDFTQSKQSNINYRVDVSKVREGEYYIRAIATDINGNKSNGLHNQYIIDRTPPQKVEDVTATIHEDYIELKWGENSEPYVGGFNVLRSESIDGEYKYISYGVNSLNLFDRDVKDGVTYYYKVACVDVAENIGEKSDSVEVKFVGPEEKDELPPVIESIYPKNNSQIGNKVDLNVTARDNIRLSKIVAQYKIGEKDWQDLKTYNVENSYGNLVAELDNSKYSKGTMLKIRVYAVDARENKSDYVFADYTIDNTPPQLSEITTFAREDGVEISWTCEDEDIKTYKVLRKKAGTDLYYLIGEYAKSINKAMDKSYEFGVDYIYKVIAIDELGNEAFKESNVIKPYSLDKTLPVAIINSVSSERQGVELTFDATGSYDNVKIADYHWDLGDGTTKSGSIVKHIFKTPGKYYVVLTVTDTSGNKNMETKLVSILGSESFGTIEVNLIDDSGKKLPNTDVFVNLGESDQYKMTSDAQGNLTLNLKEGTYKIGAYKQGYEAKHQEMLVIPGNTKSLNLILKKSEIVVGSMTATKMTLQEIENAGIDISLPENHNVYKYNINLTYQGKPYTVAHVANGANYNPLKVGTSTTTLVPIEGRNVCIGTAYVKSTGNVGVNKNVPPLVVMLDMPGEISWLKDFFDVNLQILNNQEEYDLEACVVDLNLPAGLSIVAGNKKTSNIGTLSANSSKSFNWVIRGDKPGNYNIEANFEGVLESFNEIITAKFSPEKPIKVEDGSKLKLIIEVEDTKIPGSLAFYRVGLKNERDSDLNKAKIDMKDSTFVRTYKTDSDMNILTSTHSVLKPGEILWTEYFIDPEKFKNNNDIILYLRNIAFDSLGGMKVPVEIRRVEYGSFGRINTEIYVIDSHTGREFKTSNIDLIRYKDYISFLHPFKKDDVMPDLKIKTSFIFSNEVQTPQSSKLLIKDTLFGVNKEITTDENGEYILKGGKIDNVKVDKNGRGNFRVLVSAEDGDSDSIDIRVLDQSFISNTEFGNVSGRVFDKDKSKFIEGAEVVIGSNTCITDSMGRFSFSDILLDVDNIKVKAPGFNEKNIKRNIVDGSYFMINLSNNPEITSVTSKYSDSNSNRSSIVPVNLMNDSLKFTINGDSNGFGDIMEYKYRIISRGNVIKHFGNSNDNEITIEDIKNKLSFGDRIEFAIKVYAEGKSYTSEYVDSKLVLALELKLLNNVNWLTNQETQGSTEFIPKIKSINNLVKFFRIGNQNPVGFPEDSGIFNATKLIPVEPYFDMDVSYDYLNGKMTMTNRGEILPGLLKEIAKWNNGLLDSNEYIFDLGSDLSANISSVVSYNDSNNSWFLDKMNFELVDGKVFTIDFEQSIPEETYFDGVLLSEYALVKLDGKVKSIVKPISDISKLNNINDLLDAVQANLHVGIKGKLIYKNKSGLKMQISSVIGELDADIPSWKTDIKLSYNFADKYLWFINSKYSKEWTVTQEEEKNDQSKEEQNKGNIRMLAEFPEIASDEHVYNSSPRDYLDNQKWIGKEEIIRDAYPDSNAKISAMEKGDMVMIYIGDDSKRSDNNRASLYSSLYKEGTWSQPLQIDNDGTGDACADLAVDGNNVYASWMDMTEEIADVKGMTEDEITKNVIGKMGLSIARFHLETNSWKPEINTKTEGINKLPLIDADEGKVMSVWVNNKLGIVNGNKNNPDDIYYIYNNGSGWSEAKAFVKGASDVKEGKLYLHEGMGYYVFVSNAYSEKGIYKAYVTKFDGENWSVPTELIDNSNEDSCLEVGLHNGEPVAFWHNEGMIYKISLDRPYGAQIVVNSLNTENIYEISATSTDNGAVLAWASSVGGENRLFVSSYDKERDTWTKGANIHLNPSEVPSGITLADSGDSVMIVYNKSLYKIDEDKKIYYMDNTSLTSTKYVGSVDLHIPQNGMYFESKNPILGEETKVITLIENLGDITAEGMKVSLYNNDKLIETKAMNETILYNGNSVLASFSWNVPQDASGYKLKVVVENAEDKDLSNNTATLLKSYTDAKITGVYNELYSKNKGVIFVDVNNPGYSSLNNAKVSISTDKEFSNIIEEKEIEILEPMLDKRVVFEFNPTDEQIENRARVYAKIEVDENEYNYTNNSDFTIVRPMEDNYIIETEDTTPKPTPTPTPSTKTNTKPSTKTNTTPSTTTSTAPSTTTNPTSGDASATDEVRETNNGNDFVIDIPDREIPATGAVNKKSFPYMMGFDDKTFKPDQGLTRAQLSVIIANLDGVTSKEIQKSSFKDVNNNHWAAWAINYVEQKEYFKGYSDNTYRPDNYITRAELSVVLCKYINIETNNDKAKFKDIDGHWAKDYIMNLVSEGFIKGYPDGTFKPDNNIKRSECVSIINRVLGIVPIENIRTSFTDVDDKHWAYQDIMAATYVDEKKE